MQKKAKNKVYKANKKRTFSYGENKDVSRLLWELIWQIIYGVIFQIERFALRLVYPIFILLFVWKPRKVSEKRQIVLISQKVHLCSLTATATGL